MFCFIFLIERPQEIKSTLRAPVRNRSLTSSGQAEVRPSVGSSAQGSIRNASLAARATNSGSVSSASSTVGGASNQLTGNHSKPLLRTSQSIASTNNVPGVSTISTSTTTKSLLHQSKQSRSNLSLVGSTKLSSSNASLNSNQCKTRTPSASGVRLPAGRTKIASNLTGPSNRTTVAPKKDSIEVRSSQTNLTCSGQTASPLCTPKAQSIANKIDGKAPVRSTLRTPAEIRALSNAASGSSATRTNESLISKSLPVRVQSAPTVKPPTNRLVGSTVANQKTSTEPTPVSVTTGTTSSSMKVDIIILNQDGRHSPSQPKHAFNQDGVGEKASTNSRLPTNASSTLTFRPVKKGTAADSAPESTKVARVSPIRRPAERRQLRRTLVNGSLNSSDADEEEEELEETVAPCLTGSVEQVPEIDCDGSSITSFEDQHLSSDNVTAAKTAIDEEKISPKSKCSAQDELLELFMVAHNKLKRNKQNAERSASVEPPTDHPNSTPASPAVVCNNPSHLDSAAEQPFCSLPSKPSLADPQQMFPKPHLPDQSNGWMGWSDPNGGLSNPATVQPFPNAFDSIEPNSNLTTIDDDLNGEDQTLNQLRSLDFAFNESNPIKSLSGCLRDSRVDNLDKTVKAIDSECRRRSSQLSFTDRSDVRTNVLCNSLNQCGTDSSQSESRGSMASLLISAPSSLSSGATLDANGFGVLNTVGRPLSIDRTLNCHETRQLKSELGRAREKIATLTEQLNTSTQMAAAFEQSLKSLSARAQQYSIQIEAKEQEIVKLRECVRRLRKEDVTRCTSIDWNGCNDCASDCTFKSSSGRPLGKPPVGRASVDLDETGSVASSNGSVGVMEVGSSAVRTNGGAGQSSPAPSVGWFKGSISRAFKKNSKTRSTKDKENNLLVDGVNGHEACDEKSLAAADRCSISSNEGPTYSCIEGDIHDSSFHQPHHHHPSNAFHGGHPNTDIVADLQRQLAEKDKALTDLRLATLNSDHQVATLHEKLNSLQSEVRTLKQSNHHFALSPSPSTQAAH